MNIGVMFGGRSGEHEVSLASGASVMKALNKEKYSIVPVGIDPKGTWLSPIESVQLLKKSGKLTDADIAQETFPQLVLDKTWQPIEIPRCRSAFAPDAVIVMIHGTFGEDGTMQGLLEIADVPYVGCGVLSSAVAMDKIITKEILRVSGLPVCESQGLVKAEWINRKNEILTGLRENLPFPMFVKPSNLGSSVGISKVESEAELAAAIDLAFEYDRRVIVEKGIDAREIECSLLGNDEVLVSVPAEIVPHEKFYTYSSKYTPGGADVLIPAPIDEELKSRVRDLALRAFMAIDGSGMARVDFLVDRNSREVFISEVNTIPGFTAFSAYSRMFEASGIPYPELLDRLIGLALERHREKMVIKRDYSAGS